LKKRSPILEMNQIGYLKKVVNMGNLKGNLQLKDGRSQKYNSFIGELSYVSRCQVETIKERKDQEPCT
jgi:hypothetical protein